MRFGIPDSDSEDEVDSIAFSPGDNDASFDASSPLAQRAPFLHHESDSDDEIEHIGLVNGKHTPTGLKLPLTPISKAPFTAQSGGARLNLSVFGNPDEGSGYEAWLRRTEQAALREGQRNASRRKKILTEITFNAKTSFNEEERKRVAKLEQETVLLLEGLALRSKQDEAAVVRDFEERKKRLWDDIDAAIGEVSKKQAAITAAEQLLKDEKHREEQETARKAAEQREQEDARRAAQEKLAEQRKDEAAAAARDKAEEAKQAEEAQAQAEAAKASAAAATSSSVGGEAEWRSWVDKQRWMKTEVIEKVKADRTTRTALKVSMRLITRGIGQATNKKEDIMRLITDFDKMFCEHLPGRPSPTNPTKLDSSSPVPYLYLLSHTSKALIRQAEAEVSARVESAFPLARIVVSLLMHGHAAFGEIQFARFVKKCPWVVPYYPRKRPDQSREEYEKSTGRHADEGIEAYVQRMAGSTSLYFAILQTPLAEMVSVFPSNPVPTPQQLLSLFPSPLRLNTAWTWLSLATHHPMPAYPPTTHLISCWLQIVGGDALRLWDKQLAKLLRALVDEGLKGGKLKGDSEASKQRLGQLLEDWRNLKPHPGRSWR